MPSVSSDRPDVDVAVLGSGFSGLGMAIALEKAGRRSYAVFEKAHDVGGTWRENTYPGCACDVPSHLYSFSFEKNPDWSRMYPTQPEIQRYLRRTAEKYRVLPRIRFGARVARVAFDEGAGLWDVTTADGRRTRARVVVSGMGGLHEPAFPELPGLARFAGTAFHSAQWRHDVDLSGKSVAVVGTGASAIQLVPQIAERVGRLHLFQRTPPWIVPKLDRPIRRWERGLFAKLPALMTLFRGSIYCRMEFGALGFVVNPRFMRGVQQIALRHLAQQVADPDLRAKLTPSYTIGCKRILIANDYYPALQRENVELVTDAIAEVSERGVITRDGRERPVDVLIFGTGFHPFAIGQTEVVGRGGRTLDTEWAGGAEAHLGITVAGYPNLFFLMGPNTGLGHNSMVYMIESQIEYVMDALRQLDRYDARLLDVRAETQRAYNAALQGRIGHTVWSSGCKSWYIGGSGKNATLWPGFTFEYRSKTRTVDLAEYRLS